MILLDTHALVWWVSDHPSLSQIAKATILHEETKGHIAISCISAWEIALLVERKKLILSMEVNSWLTTVAQIEAVRFLPIDVEIATKSVQLPGQFHQDPADRIIVATACKLGIPIITKDDKIRSYSHVRTIW